MFKQYLEWMPERFQQAKKEGILDVKSDVEAYPEWVDEILEKYSYLTIGIDQVKKNSKEYLNNKYNERFNDGLRFVFYQNDYYTLSGGVHDEIIMYLVKNQRMPLTKEEFFGWNTEKLCDKVPFLCCIQCFSGDGISLSESYDEFALPTKNLQRYLKKMESLGLIVIPYSIWSDSWQNEIDKLKRRRRR